MATTSPENITSRDVNGNHYQVPASQLNWRPSAYAIVIKDNQILLVKEHNGYHLPGGGVDLGESPEDCVIREVEEETGIQVTNPRLVKMLSSYFSFREVGASELTHSQSLMIYYKCEATGGRLSTDGLDEYEKSVGHTPEWVNLDQIDNLTVGTTVNWLPIVKGVIEQL